MTRSGVPSETMGERLRRILREKGDVKIAALARRLAVAYPEKNAKTWRRQLQEWAGDQKTMGDINAYRIAQVLEVPDDTFMTDRSRPSDLRVLAEAVTGLQERIDAFQMSVEGRLVALEVLLPPAERP